MIDARRAREWSLNVRALSSSLCLVADTCAAEIAQFPDDGAGRTAQKWWTYKIAFELEHLGDGAHIQYVGEN